MEKLQSKVLKATEVAVDGHFRLELTQDDDTRPTNQAASQEPVARIVENKSDGALIEIVCSCGEKIHLRCEYANAGVSTGTGPA